MSRLVIDGSIMTICLIYMCASSGLLPGVNIPPDKCHWPASAYECGDCDIGGEVRCRGFRLATSIIHLCHVGSGLYTC